MLVGAAGPWNACRAQPWQLLGTGGWDYHSTSCEAQLRFRGGQGCWWGVPTGANRLDGDFQNGTCQCCTSKVAWGCKNGSPQWLSPCGASQLVPASLEDALRLVSGSPSPMVHVFFNLVFLCWFLDKLSLCVGPLRAGFPFPAVLWFSWAYSLWFSKPGVLGACLSYAGSKGFYAWCGAQIPHSSEKTTIPLCFFLIWTQVWLRIGPNFLFAMTTFHPSDPGMGLWFKQAKQSPALGFYKGHRDGPVI